MQNQLCRVCEEPAAGFHFGAFTCEGCKSFFGRTSNNQAVISECKNNYRCVVDKKNRTACKACRLRKCLMVGMSKSGSRYGRRSNWFKIHCLMQQSMKGGPGLHGPPPPQAEPLSPPQNQSSPGASPSLPIMPTPIMGGISTSSPSSSSLSPASPPRPSWAPSARTGSHAASVKDLLLDADIDAYKSLAMTSMMNGIHGNTRIPHTLPRPRSVSPLPHSLTLPIKTSVSSQIPTRQSHTASSVSSHSPLSFLPPGHPLNNMVLNATTAQSKPPDSPPPTTSSLASQLYPPSSAAAASAALSSLYGSAAFPTSLSLMSTPGFPTLPFHKQMLLSPLLAQSHIWSQMARQCGAVPNPLLSGLSGLTSPAVSGETRSPPITASTVNGCLSPGDNRSSSTGLSPRGGAQPSPTSTSSVSPRPLISVPPPPGTGNESDIANNATLDLMAEHKALMERFASSVNAAAIAQAAQQAAIAQAAAAAAAVANQRERSRDGSVSPSQTKENGISKQLNQEMSLRKVQSKKRHDENIPMDLSSNKKDDMEYESEEEEINISDNDDPAVKQNPSKRPRKDLCLSSDLEREVGALKKIMIKSDLNRNNVRMESVDKNDSSEKQETADDANHSLNSVNIAKKHHEEDED